MPTITKPQFRALVQQKAQDGVLDEKDINGLIKTAVGDSDSLDAGLAEVLEEVLSQYGDSLDSSTTREKLSNFLAIKDPGLQAQSFKMSESDGRIDAAEATALLQQAADGGIGETKYSLGAILVGSRMSPEARDAFISELDLGTSKVSTEVDTQIGRGGAGTKVPLTFSDSHFPIAKLAVDINVEHPTPERLELTLIAPDGTSVLLQDGISSTNVGNDLTFDLENVEGMQGVLGKNPGGRWGLNVRDMQNLESGTIKGWSIDVTTTGQLGSPPVENEGVAVPLHPAGHHRPVFINDNGHAVLSDTSENPQTAADISSGLFRMAEVVDDHAGNPFDAASVPLETREKMLANLQETLQTVPAAGVRPDDLSELQALQLRSSIATTLLSLIDAQASSPEHSALQAEAFMAYRGMLSSEENVVLKDSMTWNLVAMKDQLPPTLKTQADRVHETLAPVSPPYDEWFSDGNSTINISWNTGTETEFFAGTRNMLEDDGFVVEGTNRDRPPITMSKAVEEDGVETTFRITIKPNHGDTIFEHMDDESMHIVGYNGHSGFGRNVATSLENGTEESGKKLIFYGVCAGKDNISRVREQYPDSQLLTTFTSSYFRTRTDPTTGQKVMNASEDVNALKLLMGGIAKRSSWENINEDIRDNAVWPGHHVMPGGTNYISPAHTMIRRKVLDTDNDGQADILDKHVQFDTHKIAEDTEREFTAIDPGRSANRLDGTRPHLAAMGINTATGYNSHMKKWKKQNVIGAGYFEPKAQDEGRVVKFKKATIDGIDSLEMSINKNYAHMSVEALRAIGGYQLMLDHGSTNVGWQGDEMTPGQQKAMALVFAYALLNYDSGGWQRDKEIWSSLLVDLNFPLALLNAPSSQIRDEHHDYTGNTKVMQRWLEQFPADVIAKLEDPTVGVPHAD